MYALFRPGVSPPSQLRIVGIIESRITVELTRRHEKKQPPPRHASVRTAAVAGGYVFRATAARVQRFVGRHISPSRVTLPSATAIPATNDSSWERPESSVFSRL